MNPFFGISPVDGSEYLTSRCSLNRAVLQKLPVRGIEDGIEGRAFKDIFSTPLLVREIQDRARDYGVDISSYDEHMLPHFLNMAMESDSARERTMAQRVVEKFGNRLGILLLALRQGDPENRRARADWNDACWDCWHDLSTLILTGGLASSMLGRRFKEQIQYVFDCAGEQPYHIRLFDNGAYLGVMGVAQRLLPDGETGVVFDFGHTNFKRAVVTKSGGVITGFSPMDTKKSKYMRSRFDSEAEHRAYAMDLHRYIVNTIVTSFKEAQVVHRELSDRVIISIASYTYSGILDAGRGGYAKLCKLGENYASILGEDISSELHRELRVRLIHDGTATALYFSDVPDSVCITLGTGFGVGFPQIRLN